MDVSGRTWGNPGSIDELYLRNPMEPPDLLGLPPENDEPPPPLAARLQELARRSSQNNPIAKRTTRMRQYSYNRFVDDDPGREGGQASPIRLLASLASSTASVLEGPLKLRPQSLTVGVHHRNRLASHNRKILQEQQAEGKALEMCNRDFFPNIHSLLSILATLPVSTSTPERTFSTLRRLKSYLRNHMNNDRLTGLALLSIHRELQVTPEQVLTEFCKLPRRKNFLV
ncbi:hypothetical protein HPB52_008050 [Rhipicephalus sanguineus]|uniref:HAT C-terminal dimerisation domain-containing protein n=1 Tax=Rhipicephalus sanguineus TaxID=34632 RepID=A0A9D4PM12_RHISA|nr:hypothetical protein HPB52_008050 [Rhipicephalus sanguineus]